MSAIMKVIVVLCAIAGAGMLWWRVDIAAGFVCGVTIAAMWFGGYALSDLLQKSGDRVGAARITLVLVALGGVCGMMLYGSVGGFRAWMTPAVDEPSAGAAILIGGAGVLAGLAGYLTLLGRTRTE